MWTYKHQIYYLIITWCFLTDLLTECEICIFVITVVTSNNLCVSNSISIYILSSHLWISSSQIDFSTLLLTDQRYLLNVSKFIKYSDFSYYLMSSRTWYSWTVFKKISKKTDIRSWQRTHLICLLINIINLIYLLIIIIILTNIFCFIFARRLVFSILSFFDFTFLWDASHEMFCKLHYCCFFIRLNADEKTWKYFLLNFNKIKEIS